MASELWLRRELILSLVRRDLKTRYRSSILGFLWSICKPLLLMLVLYVVFTQIVDLRGIFDPPMATPFALFVLSGILAWTYLSGAVGEGMYAVIGNASLVKKTYIPHEVFPIVSILSNLFHFLLALLVYFGLLLLFGGHPPWQVVFLPLVIALQTLFLLGLVMLLSALNVFYRDVASIMEVIITAWFYLSPILYPLREPLRRIDAAEDIPDWVFHLYMLNPMAPILGAYHKVLLLPAFGDTEFRTAAEEKWLLVYLGVAALTSTILFFVGCGLFRHYRGRFADEV